VGPAETTKSVVATPNSLNQLRRQIEQFHQGPDPRAVSFVWPYLKHPDRFIRYAARLALEHQPAQTWKDKAYQEKDPVTATQALVGLIRQSKPEFKTAIYGALLAINHRSFSQAQLLDLFRAYELAMLRLGMPDDKISAQIIAQFDARFPANNMNLDRALSRLLIPLEAPKVIERTLKIMQTKDTASATAYRVESATSSADLIMRNPEYGTDIAKMLEKMPPAQQTYMAVVLSAARKNWTPELHAQYFSWFKKSFEFSGGRSYVGFIDRARKLALKNVPESQKNYYNKLGGADLVTANGNDMASINYPKGPGKSWKLEEAVALLDAPLEGRDFENGKSMFAATTCIRCHAIGSEGGGNIGPDLSNLGTRFSKKDMLEAIINPNKTVSDQYAATQFMLRNGTSVIGRLTNQDKTAFYVSQNPYAPDQVEKVWKKNVISAKYSPVSIMLPGLINSLNAEELKDLMAYLMSNGNSTNAMFKKQ
jgi:putative heme-binding domain-containing protein